MTLDVRLLGQLAVTRDGQRLELRSRPAQLLLAYLVLHAGRSVRRDKLAGVLWPDSDERAALKNLRQTLWRLRNVIGDACLDVDPRAVRLKPGTVTSDIAVLMDSDVPDDPDALARAVEHYDELLPGHYQDWIQAASAPLRASYDNRMARLLRALAVRERWDEVREWSERWIAHGSVPERAYRALMRAHASVGDLGGVADSYRRCVIDLQHELGVEPSDKTRALHHRLLSGRDPALAAGGTGPPWPSMPSVSFVGSTSIIEHSVLIDRPHDEVFRVMLDPELARLYRSNVLQYDVLVGSPGEPGTQVRAVKKLGSETFQFVVEVEDAEPGRWLLSRTIDSPVGICIETWVEDEADGTRMTQRRELELPEGFGGVDDSVLVRWYAADVHSDFEKLKQLIENGLPPAHR